MLVLLLRNKKIIDISPQHLSRDEYTMASIFPIGVELAAAEVIRFHDYCRREYPKMGAQRHVAEYRKGSIIEANYPHQEGPTETRIGHALCGNGSGWSNGQDLMPDNPGI
jgi:hypothetical protein